jgi:plasmid maintenance system antidote protein VapI
MTRTALFEPDWYSPPGETVADALRAQRINADDFTRRMRLTRPETEALLEGRVAITQDLATRLAGVVGSTASFWMAREDQYRSDLARLTQREFSKQEREWLQALPVADMIQFGWISVGSSAREKFAACLSFFGVSSLAEWRTRGEVAVAFKTSPTFESRPEAVAAWLRQGERVGASIECKAWNADRFQGSLAAIRALAQRRDPQTFLPELQKICADCGVAVACVPAPRGCMANGATRFVTPEKALLLLSFRHRFFDHFWFAFFHEAGHLLLHSHQTTFVEWPGASSTAEEDEADSFAAQTLVPPEREAEMLKLRPLAMDVIRFARRIGIAPGIVVGQLQHSGRLRRNQLNGLKRKFEWK